MAIHEPAGRAAVDGQLVYRSFYLFPVGPIRSIPDFLELQVRRMAEDLGILTAPDLSEELDDEVLEIQVPDDDRDFLGIEDEPDVPEPSRPSELEEQFPIPTIAGGRVPRTFAENSDHHRHHLPAKRSSRKGKSRMNRNRYTPYCHPQNYGRIRPRENGKI